MSDLPDYLKNAPALSADEAAQILRNIPRPPRDEWIKLICATVAAIGETDALNVLTAQFPDEKPNETAIAIRKETAKGIKCSAASLIYLAQAHGFDASAFFKARAARLKEEAGTRPKPAPAAAVPAAQSSAAGTHSDAPPRERRGNAANPPNASHAGKPAPLPRVDLGKCSICEAANLAENIAETSLLACCKAIKAGKWKSAVDDYRAGKRPKHTLPQVCAYGVYHERRRDENLHTRSGFLVLDFDGKDNPNADFPKLKARFAKLPFTLAAFASPSGNGLKAVIRVPDDLNAAAALDLAAKTLAPFRAKLDTQAAAGKHFFVSYDESAYVNPAPLNEIPPLAPFENLSRDALGVIFEDMIERFFFAGKETYYFDEQDGRPFKELGKSDAAEEFEAEYKIDRKTARRALHAVRKLRHVSAVYPALSCRFRGIHQLGERRVLVLESTNPIYPEEGGEYTIWKTMFETVFKGESEQLRRLLAWLYFAVKRYLECVESGGERIQPVPMLILLGLKGSGKTLLAECLRLLLGNRPAGSGKNFILERPWLGDIIGNECILVSETRTLKSDERGALKAADKEVLSGEGYFAESKNKAGFMIKNQHFLIHMANNEENGNCAASCPALDDDFKDKYLAFSTANAEAVKSAFPKRDEEKNQKLFREQAPAFLHWLFAYYAETIPEDWKDERFGVKHYEAAAATRSLFEVSLAAELHGKFLSLLKDAYDTDFRDKKFTSTELSEKIAARFGGKMIYSGTLGKAMNELCETFPEIYEKPARNQYSFRRPPENAAALVPAAQSSAADANGAGTREAAQGVSPFTGLPL